MMKLRTYQTLWGWEGSAEEALLAARGRGFDGLEGRMREGWEDFFCESDYIAEIVTGDDYAPKIRKGIREHGDDLRRGIEASLKGKPRFANVLAGCDWWSFEDKVAFGEMFLEMEKEYQLPLSLETHRSRMTFHPWVTRDLLAELPELMLTCDFSHWCCVTERLVMDEEPELLRLLASRCRHVHARVGYDQGPQVPAPRLEKYREELEAHLRWWKGLWDFSKLHERDEFTMTPEFGPDGYQQSSPESGEVFAPLGEINSWMGDCLRAVFR
ncbi:hypothetical protein AAFN60_08775 [Roseibacillus persicicus]|uniref:sugar phosphate isomerase/epimerase n=1 Tax=Roseibacillus persicicus TaxID=454148 RepID=UPI00398BB75B